MEHLSTAPAPLLSELQLFEHAPVPMSCSFFDQQGRFCGHRWNQAWYEAFGYSPEQAEGRAGVEFGFWEDKHQKSREYDLDMSGPTICTVVLELRHANGQPRTVEVSGHTVVIDGQPTLLISYIDKTERIQQDIKLREYQNMVQNTMDGMLLTENGLIVECNPGTERIFELPRERLLGLAPLDLVPPEAELQGATREEVQQALHTASQGVAQHFFWRQTRPDGRWLTLDVTLTPVPHSAGPGGLYRLLIVMRDINEMHRSMELQALNEQRFRKLFELAPVPLLLFYTDGQITGLNQQFERVLGYQISDIPTVSAWRRQAYPDTSHRQSIRQRSLELIHEMDRAVGTIQMMETPIRCKNGQTRIMQVNIGKMGDETLAMFLDITEIRAAQNALQTLNTELEARVQDRTQALQTAVNDLQRTQTELVRSEKLASLGALVAGVAHELNTPIGNAVMVASTLFDLCEQFAQTIAHNGLRRSTLDQFLADWREACEVMERNLSRAAELINSFKQVAVDQSSYQRRPFDLAEVLHELRLTLSPTLKRAQVVLHEEVPHGLRLDSYPGPLTQVLMNVVNNAVQHGLDGRADGVIHLSGQALPDQRVRITVTDNGCGIPGTVLPRIFDPFFTTKLGQGGSGLGLHIVYSLVTELLGGSVSVNSSPGAGSTFTIDIPLCAPHMPQAPVQHPRVQA